MTATIRSLKIEITEDCDGYLTGTLTEITSGHRYACRFGDSAAALMADLTALATEIAGR